MVEGDEDEDHAMANHNNTNSNDPPIDTILTPASSTTAADDYFVTAPPKRSIMTGGISTLFRRVSSRDRRGEVNAANNGLVEPPEYETDILSVSDAEGPTAAPADADAIGSEEEDVVVLSTDYSSRGGERSESGANDVNPVTSADMFSSSAPSMTSREDDGGEDMSHSHHMKRTRSHTKRIYASSYTDYDSDDSFETRQTSHSQALSHATTRDSGYVDYGDSQSFETLDNASKNPLRRFRGFSTSIASLFLDESLVCTSIGCFGLILSNRTEHLLQVRDHIRGVKQSRKNQTADKRSPSKVFSYLLLLTIILIFMTFVIGGFGNGNALEEDLMYDGNGDDAVVADDAVDNSQDQDNNNNQGGDDDDYYHNQVDDDGNVNDDANGDDNDDGNNNNNNNNNIDDDNQNNNDDDAVQQGDDATQQANDDAQEDANDDANAAVNDDANAAANDDDVNNNDAYDGDDFYAADDDDRRKLERSKAFQLDSNTNISSTHEHHRATGIFKLRDCQENVWDPVFDFAQQQWDREAHANRRLADAWEEYDGDAESEDWEYEAPERDLATDVRTALLLTFLLFLGVLGRRRRMRTRFQLVRARAQDDRLYQMSHSGRSRHTSMKDELEDKAYEVACSHTILGCYPVDPPGDDYDEEEVLGVNEQGITTSRKFVPNNADFVSRAFACLMTTCCGFCCKCWVQCLSVCALAQEAREMRLLLPPRYQRIDYITHQPFSEYQKDVNELRRGWMGKKRKKSGLLPHINALSRLSRYILFTAGGTLLVIMFTLFFNPRAAFSWPDVVLLVATFVQSFLVLYIVHWIFHKSDLSLDAVIKFFAAGFVIAVPSAVFFEGVIVNMILISAWTVYEIGHSLIGESFAEWMASNYKWVWVLGELFNAYIVAAVTEELCKYYTFRSVEHPDLIFLTGLDRKSHDNHTVDGGLTPYPFASHQVSDLNRNNSFASTQKSREDKLKKILPSANTLEEFHEDENDVRTYRQKAAAVTTGMISVAVGLACAENMMYVFLLGGAKGSSAAEHRGDIYEEWIVLLFRSVFPIHALAAALQSTNMVRKFVEGTTLNNHRIGVGRIILPAVMLHGTFDAILMGINVYVESAWDAYLEENEGRVGDGEPYNPRTVNFVAWCSICMVTLIGFLWHLKEHRNQQSRLILLEEEDKEEPSYISPAGVTPQQAKPESQRRKV